MRRFLTLLLALVLTAGLSAPLPVRAETGGRLVALTFDDGPGPYTGRLLDGLKARDIQVTFFMVGSQIKKYPALAARAFREGHQLANHSYSHPDLTKLSDRDIDSQLQTTASLLDTATGGAGTYLVRAPYGSTNARVRSAAGAPLVLWSVDPLDWKDRKASTVRDRVVNGAFDGAIILLHDIHSTSVDGALEAIDILRARGYEFVTVRELFRRRGVSMKSGTSYGSCKPNDTDPGPVEKPVFASRVADGRLEVLLTAREGTDIYYSLEGPGLDRTSTKYTGPFTVSPPCTIWAAAAYDLNGSRSAVVEQNYPKPPAQAPVIQVSGGRITLQIRTTGVRLFYTLNGTAATEKSAEYTGPVALTPGTVVSACAGGEDWLTSAASRVFYSPRGNLFRDVFPGSWYCEAVDRAAQAGMMTGLGDGVFAPEAPLTRAQFVTLLYRNAGGEANRPEQAVCPFRDLEPGSFYEEAARWAFAAGLVSGYERDRFSPDAPITRQEMAVVLARLLPAEEADGEEAPLPYSDAADVALWARQAVGTVTARGLMCGDESGAFRPEDGAARAQAAAVLLRLAELVPPASTEAQPGDP